MSWGHYTPDFTLETNTGRAGFHHGRRGVCGPPARGFFPAPMTQNLSRDATLKPMETGRVRLEPPDGERRVLLHSCCAPCSGEVIEAMTHSGLELTVFFYNPNIHPRREYLLRKEENIHFCKARGVPFVDADYDPKEWFERARGMEWEPERGIRCTMCFDLRFERTADYAVANGFRVFTSSLGLSRWKDMDQINACGVRAAARRTGLTYWTYNWRKGGGSDRMVEISKREGFYQQQYCGCVYSLRDTNARRERAGRPKVRIGETFYSLFPKQP